MIQNYFTVMYRSMIHRKFHTIVNVLCLTTGITFAMLIGLFIHGELQVNQNLKDVDHLYLVQNKVIDQGSGIDFFSPPVLVKTVSEQYSNEVISYYRFWDRNITISKGKNHFRIQSMIGDASLINTFGFKVLYGDDTKALKEPNSIVVTEQVAQLFFSRTNVVDETIDVSTERNGVKEYKITAVIAEPEDKNTVTDLMNMNAQVFISFENQRDFFADSNPDSWQGGIIGYIRTGEKTAKSKVEKILNDVLQTQAPKQVSENRSIELAPLNDYYLVTNHGAVTKLILSLTVIVIFILVLAITNFVNISIAKSFSRLKEVGVRKVIGGSRKQLIFQFILESVLLAGFSGVLSIILYQILYPLFNTLLAANLPSILLFRPLLWCAVAGGVLFIGLLAGTYPAFFQSASRPIESLKGKSKSVQGTVSLSRVLLAIQFMITIFIFTAAIVLSQQTTFFLESDLGYNKSSVIIVSSVPRQWTDEGFRRMDAAKTEFMQSGKLKSVSLSWGAPGWGIGGGQLTTLYKAGSLKESGVQGNVTGVDETFHDVYQVKLLEGDFLFGANEQWASGRVVINDAARKSLGLAIGDKIKLDGSINEFTVAGMVADFHYESMHESVKPAVFMHNRDFGSYRFFSFNVPRLNPVTAVAVVEALWKKVFPNEAFTYHFADERLQALYATELQLKKAFSVATILMLVMVMTGLLGLVSLNVSRRNKEIGIRKVLGASVAGILTMISREYTRLMTVSFIVALPVAYYFSNAWLNNFVYHIELAWWIFLVPATLLLLITIAIVSFQSYQTAATDPVKSLRHE
jgi:putative ABC transport system permease protein